MKQSPDNRCLSIHLSIIKNQCKYGKYPTLQKTSYNPAPDNAIDVQSEVIKCAVMNHVRHLCLRFINSDFIANVGNALAIGDWSTHHYIKLTLKTASDSCSYT